MEPGLPYSKQKDLYNDEQVIASILAANDANQLVLNWFFQTSRKYAQSYLTPIYPNIEGLGWDVIFANVNLKFITRIKKGLTLNPDTKLTTYYTSIAKFAALDFVRDQQDQQNYQSIEEGQIVEDPSIVKNMEREERSQEIKVWLSRIIGNEDQVKVLLLQAEGLSYKDIVNQTVYQSEGACRNASLKGKKKIADYLVQNPESAKVIRKLLQGN